MSQWEHERKPGYLAAWKQIGLNQTYGPEISQGRRAWLAARRSLKSLFVDVSVPFMAPLHLAWRKRA